MLARAPTVAFALVVAFLATGCLGGLGGADNEPPEGFAGLVLRDQASQLTIPAGTTWTVLDLFLPADAAQREGFGDYRQSFEIAFDPAATYDSFEAALIDVDDDTLKSFDRMANMSGREVMTGDRTAQRYLLVVLVENLTAPAQLAVMRAHDEPDMIDAITPTAQGVGGRASIYDEREGATPVARDVTVNDTRATGGPLQLLASHTNGAALHLAQFTVGSATPSTVEWKFAAHVGNAQTSDTGTATEDTGSSTSRELIGFGPNASACLSTQPQSGGDGRTMLALLSVPWDPASIGLRAGGGAPASAGDATCEA